VKANPVDLVPRIGHGEIGEPGEIVIVKFIGETDPETDPVVEAVEKASGKSRLRDAGESDLTECATIDVLRPR
jgi:hypothetical protein